MKRLLYVMMMLLLLAACGETEEQLRQRAAELCKYIPDHELKEQSKDYMTQDFYAVLDTMFNQLPEHEAMDHEWLYYFVTGNGGTIADYEVKGVKKTDDSHAVATILVRQKWEDGSFDESTDVEQHQLLMELVDGKWLMADFDNHKADCIRHIQISRKEQAIRDAMSDYLIKEIGSQYALGDICIPTLLIAAEEEDSVQSKVYCDTWIFWYQQTGDTLKTISGVNHSGCMTVMLKNGKPVVTAFEQTTDGAGYEASAKRIFGKHYEVYHNMHSNQDVREAARKEQLQEYLRHHELYNK